MAKSFFDFEGNAQFFTVRLSEVGPEIPVDGVAFSHQVGHHKVVRPDTFPFCVREIKVQSFHCFRGSILVAVGIINNKETIKWFILLRSNSVCAPRRLFQKTGHTAKVTVLPGMVPYLRDCLSSLGQVDSMHDGNKVMAKTKKNNELDVS
ncbi:hypothetical protein [Bacillus sp. V5-8f]|uniref:hypothetical protein n=1 Tax=Bacillus sp. V5-8f TaxID=2053044 RepID=UPI000C75B46D|nr:hypothetical protein [Bacillus sp. V5-8f]PLT32601.1 hypothetical protein CUU64_18195 [Bacillus sp. V5-8f]